MVEAWLTDAAVLGALGFLLVTVVLYVLAERYRQAVERHDLLREAEAKRREFDEAVEERRQLVEGGPAGNPLIAGRIAPAAAEEDASAERREAA